MRPASCRISRVVSCLGFEAASTTRRPHFGSATTADGGWRVVVVFWVASCMVFSALQGVRRGGECPPLRADREPPGTDGAQPQGLRRNGVDPLRRRRTLAGHLPVERAGGAALLAFPVAANLALPAFDITSVCGGAQFTVARQVHLAAAVESNQFFDEPNRP